ncbi:DUF1133 family protein, partial [Escherichia coli]|nr:DUF1133 family protein [Escherichia coli]
EMIAGRQKSWLSHCTDAEALRIDGVISKALASYPGLIDILRQRYEGRGMSKRKMAELLNEVHPEWCYATCRNRIDMWLRIAEFILYPLMWDAFSFTDA